MHNFSFRRPILAQLARRTSAPVKGSSKALYLRGTRSEKGGVLSIRGVYRKHLICAIMRPRNLDPARRSGSRKIGDINHKGRGDHSPRNGGLRKNKSIKHYEARAEARTIAAQALFIIIEENLKSRIPPPKRNEINGASTYKNKTKPNLLTL